MKANVGGELENPVCASLDPAYCPWLDWMEQAETGVKWDKCENAGWHNDEEFNTAAVDNAGWQNEEDVENQDGFTTADGDENALQAEEVNDHGKIDSQILLQFRYCEKATKNKNVSHLFWKLPRQF